MAISVATIAFGAVVVVGCSSSYNNPGTAAQPTTYDGTFTGAGGANGTLALTITPPAAAFQPAMMPLAVATDTVSGTIHPLGMAPTDLTGTFTPPYGPLDVSGGQYHLTGMLQGGVLSGTFSGGGSFTALVSGGTNAVTQFCGTYAGDDSGAWNLSKSGTSLSGSFASSGSASQGVLTGTIHNDNSVTLNYSGGSATGTLNGSTMSGTWTSGVKTGTWTGSSTACN